MQHVEEAGVHSGDSSCVLPAPSLDERGVRRGVPRRAPARAGARRRRAAERPARARRRRALRARGEPARVPHRAVREQGDRRQPRRRGGPARRPARACTSSRCPTERRPEQVSVKAAVLPFARFPGADPVLGPEMRSTGEVMASAADLPTAFAKAERAAGRPLPTRRHARSSPSATPTRPRSCRSRAALAALGFRLLATRGTAAVLAAAGLAVDTVAEGRRRRRPDPRRPLRPRRQHAAGLGARRRLPDPRGGARRARAVHHDARRRRGRGRRDRERAARRSRAPCRSGSSVRRELRSVIGAETVGPYTLLRVARGGLDPGRRGSSSCSRRPAGCCRGR